VAGWQDGIERLGGVESCRELERHNSVEWDNEEGGHSDEKS
jgi:hypothetical protein